MHLSEAIQFTVEHRPSWKTGKGANTAMINANHCLRLLGDIDLMTIASKDINLMSDKLKEEGKAAGTINRITAALNTILKTLNQYGIEVPTPSFVRQKESKGRVVFYSDEDIEKILTVAEAWGDNYLLYDSIQFALKTGCRQGEMLTLTVDNVDLTAMEVVFLDTKNGRDHVLPISESLAPIITRRIEQSTDGILFGWDNKDHLLRTLKKVNKLAGVADGKVWHTFRHTTATKLCEKGVPIRTVMGVLNHQNVSTTLRYAKSTLRSKADALDLL